MGFKMKTLLNNAFKDMWWDLNWFDGRYLIVNQFQGLIELTMVVGRDEEWAEHNVSSKSCHSHAYETGGGGGGVHCPPPPNFGNVSNSVKYSGKIFVTVKAGLVGTWSFNVQGRALCLPGCSTRDAAVVKPFGVRLGFTDPTPVGLEWSWKPRYRVHRERHPIR